MNPDAVARLFEGRATVRLDRTGRDAVLESAAVVEIPAVSFAGGPTLLRLGERLAALEQALPDPVWVFRPLEGEDDARAFLRRRRDDYDRLWDGCGCRIDYDS